MAQLRGGLWFVVFAAMLLAFPLGAAAQSAPVTDDTFAQPNTPAEKEGADPFLVVRGPGSNTYLRFDLSVLPTGVTSANVSKATLRLFVSGVTTPGNFDVFLVNGVWSEKTLTFNNAPTHSTLVNGGVSVAASGGGSYLLVDVTSAVTAWLSGTANDGLALVPSANSKLSVQFDSKEAFFTSHDPELEIDVASFGPQGPAGPQGPQGVQGPPGAQGLMGFQGPKGDPGPQGAQGPAGSQGPKGDTGSTGATGAAGPAGAQGSQGPMGPQGQKGDTGATGATGAAGQPGAAGAPGAQGSAGPAGPAGPAGAQGPAGPQGNPGLGSITAVTASAPLASSGGTAPDISLSGIVPIANGGTSSSTQNFVDLSSVQSSIGGNKTFTGQMVVSNSATAALIGQSSSANGTGIVAVGNNIQSVSSLLTGSGLAAVGTTTGLYAASTTAGAGQAIYTSQFANVVLVNYFDGATQYKIIGNGTVSTLVQSPDVGTHVMFAPEAPEVLFEDYGTGQLVGGRTHIEFDPIYAANVTINPDHPARVFIQLEGDCNGVFVTNKSSTGFDVVELARGTSNTTFSWHAVANRADEESTDPSGQAGSDRKVSHYSDARLPVAPELRSNMRPVRAPRSPVP